MPFPIKIFIFATVRCFPAWRSLSCCVSVCDARNVCVMQYPNSMVLCLNDNILLLLTDERLAVSEFRINTHTHT
ncbi:hypothetical protein, partial [Bacteroides heparinolyticus]